MGIREIIAQKKLQKEPNIMMPLMLDEVYKRIKSLTDAQFHDYEADLKQKVDNIARDLTVMCQQMTHNMQIHEQTAIARIQEIATNSGVDFTNEVQSIRDESKKQIDKLAKNLIAQVDIIASNIEKMRGPQGVPGEKGDKGNDGSPDTAEQVVVKVNKAKGVKISSIDGLEEELKKVKKATTGGKSGGGMGNVYHETKAISSGTTSVTTTYPIAASGRAIWIYLQGQFLVYGTHYTTNGRIINLLFTPSVDNTNLDITYVRS